MIHYTTPSGWQGRLKLHFFSCPLAFAVIFWKNNDMSLLPGSKSTVRNMTSDDTGAQSLKKIKKQAGLSAYAKFVDALAQRGEEGISAAAHFQEICPLGRLSEEIPAYYDPHNPSYGFLLKHIRQGLLGITIRDSIDLLAGIIDLEVSAATIRKLEVDQSPTPLITREALDGLIAKYAEKYCELFKENKIGVSIGERPADPEVHEDTFDFVYDNFRRLLAENDKAGRISQSFGEIYPKDRFVEGVGAYAKDGRLTQSQLLKHIRHASGLDRDEVVSDKARHVHYSQDGDGPEFVAAHKPELTNERLSMYEVGLPFAGNDKLSIEQLLRYYAVTMLRAGRVQQPLPPFSQPER